MAASKLVQEIHSIGDRLLLKLQRLPQAEPVEVLAFSVLVVFTGKPGLPESPWHPGLFLASGRGNHGASRRAGWFPRQRRSSRCLQRVGLGAGDLPLFSDMLRLGRGCAENQGPGVKGAKALGAGVGTVTPLPRFSVLLNR